jgi:hypothetical protein
VPLAASISPDIFLSYSRDDHADPEPEALRLNHLDRRQDMKSGRLAAAFRLRRVLP